MPDELAPEFDARESIRAVRFEYEMAVETATRVHPILRPSSDDEFVLAVAYVESFLVHARCLDEFLSSRGTYKTDVKASDFVPGFAEGPLDSEVLDSINHALQHITVYRQDGHIPWVPMDLLRPIVPVMGRFIEQLSREEADLVGWISDVQNKALESLEAVTVSRSTALSTSQTWFTIGPTRADDDVEDGT